MNLEHTMKMIEAARMEWKQFDDQWWKQDYKEYSSHANEGDLRLRAVLQEDWQDQNDDWGNVKWAIASAYIAFRSKDGKCMLKPYPSLKTIGEASNRNRTFYNSSGDYEIKFENVNK